MRIWIFSLAMIGAFGLSACDNGNAEIAQDLSEVEEAQACDYGALIGEVYQEGILGDIDGRPVRLLYTDSMATMDYNPERINIYLEKDVGVITDIRCG